jgi:ATP-binding protein involved in chromosome partitioning
MDADIYGPSIPLMLGAKGQLMQAPSGQIRPLERYNLKLMSIGFAVDEGTPVIWRGLMIMKMLKNFLLNVAWGELDYLIIDLPPGTGDAQLTLVQTVEVDGAVVVTTPQDVSLADVRKAYEMFRTVKVPVLGIVENMSGFVCPKCGHEEHIFRQGGGPRFAEEEGVPLLGRIPLNSAICEGGDQGVPVAYKIPDSPEAKAFQAVAASVAQVFAK